MQSACPRKAAFDLGTALSLGGEIFQHLWSSTMPAWLQPPWHRGVFPGLLLTNVPIPIAANIGTQTVSTRMPSSPTLLRGAPQYKYSSAVRNIQPMGHVPPMVAPQVTSSWPQHHHRHVSALVLPWVNASADLGQPRGSV